MTDKFDSMRISRFSVVMIIGIILAMALLGFKLYDNFSEKLSAAQSRVAALGLNPVQTIDDSQTVVAFTDKSKFTFKCKKFTLSKGALVYDNSFLPVNAADCEPYAPKRTRKAVIWLRGGPFFSFNGDIDPVRSIYLSRGYTLLEPDYLGTKERGLSINMQYDYRNFSLRNNVRKSVKEVSALIDYAKANYDHIDVVGKSFGGFLLSLYVSESAQNEPSLRYVFYVTMTSTPAEQIISPKTAIVKIADINIHSMLLNSSIPINGRVGNISELDIESKRKFYEAILEKFFSDAKDKSTLKLLEPVKDQPLYFVVGSKDDRVCSQCIADFAKAGENRRLLVFPELGHEFPRTKSQQDKLAAFLFTDNSRK
jgi:hypothetical protein